MIARLKLWQNDTRIRGTRSGWPEYDSDMPDARRGAMEQGLLRQDGTPYKQALTAFRHANQEVIRRLRREFKTK